ncbi:hypothetical protein IFM89_023346 [Coptis chinensis]|uniref:AT-rich interactive domain-containing protein 3 n=1 Tax=Coptis chinensis TaxID=261450 RepID=A0A835HM10_9MAGN|nr:hypothetical protein IFM89_023346 [Coptis chinensis]
MSERKEDEEMVEEQGGSGSASDSSSDSDESEHLVDAQVELHDELDEQEEGNQEDVPIHSTEANVELPEEAKVNENDAVKTTVDGSSNGEEVTEEGYVMINQTETVVPVNEEVLDVKEDDKGVSDVKEDEIMEESKNVEELKDAEETKDVEETKDAEDSKNVEESKEVEVSKDIEEPKKVEESKDIEELKDMEVSENREESKEVEEPEEVKNVKELKNVEEPKKQVVVAAVGSPVRVGNGVKEERLTMKREAVLEQYPRNIGTSNNQLVLAGPYTFDGDDTGTEEEQAAFIVELDNFFRERGLEFKHPKFYGEGLNCLKLWRAVTGLGGYDRVTACKLWRQVGESFKPPKTCTTVSWSFRIFYEKSLLDYERHKMRGGELHIPASPLSEPMSVDNHMIGHQGSGSGRARRDAAARAMQGWHSQRLLGNGEVGDPIIKDKHSMSIPKREKQLKSVGLLKRKKSSIMDRSVKAARTITKVSKPQIETEVVDLGPAADWVKINVRRTKDCFEVYALVPGLLREEVRVQSDPAGRLVISGDPEQPDNPWGVTPFKKVVSLPSRIDPHQTSAVVTLHGQLFVRVPFEQSDL